MQITVRGKRWTLERPRLNGEVHGWCDAPDKPGKTIKVDRRLKGQQELEVIIHEIIHAAMWDASEECVDETAADVARALWRLGYRMSDGEK